MSSYEIEVRFAIVPVSRVDEMTDGLMEPLLDEPDIVDPDLGTNLESGHIDVVMVIDAEDQVSAMSVGFSALRSALHRIGGHTPGWEADLQQAVANVRPPAPAA